jgi:PKD repeat protein
MYLWDFGDGNISSLEEPMHTYSDAGIYDVSLTVYSGSCVSRKFEAQYVRVDTAHADFVYTTNQICFPSNAVFTDLSVNPVEWHWYFGDGDTSSVQNLIIHILIILWFLSGNDRYGCIDTAL